MAHGLHLTLGDYWNSGLSQISKRNEVEMRKSRGESAVSHKALLSWEVITGAPRKAKFTTSEGLCEFNVLSFTKISYGLHLFSKFHVLPVSIFSLTEEVLWGWKFNLCCNSANNGMRVWVWNLSPLATEDKVWFEGRHRSFQLIYSDLNLGISLPEVIFFFLFCNIVSSNQPILLYSFIWAECLHGSNLWSLTVRLCFRCPIGSILVVISVYLCAASCYRTIVLLLINENSHLCL